MASLSDWLIEELEQLAEQEEYRDGQLLTISNDDDTHLLSYTDGNRWLREASLPPPGNQ